MLWKLYTSAQLFCLTIRKIVQRIVSLVPPCRSNIFLSSSTILSFGYIRVERIPSTRDQQTMWAPPDQRVSSISSNWDRYFAFFPANLASSTCTDRKRPCRRCTNKHSQFGTFSLPSPNRIFQIVFPTSPASGVSTNISFNRNRFFNVGP